MDLLRRLEQLGSVGREVNPPDDRAPDREQADLVFRRDSLDESGHGLPERVDRLPPTDAAPVVDQQRDLHRLGPDLGRHDLRVAPFLGDPKLLRPEIGHRSPVFIGDRYVDAAELLGAHRSHPGDTREGHHNESCHQRCEAVLHCLPAPDHPLGCLCRRRLSTTGGTPSWHASAP